MLNQRNLFIITLTLFAGLSRSISIDNLTCTQACDSFECTCIDSLPIFQTSQSVIFRIQTPENVKCMGLRVQSSKIFPEGIVHDLEMTKFLSDSNSVVNILSSKEIDGFVFQLLDLCNFVSLQTYLNTHPDIKRDGMETLRLFLGLLNALSAVHRKSVVHANLQLSSVAINEMKEVRLLNFHNSVVSAEADGSKAEMNGQNSANLHNLGLALLRISPKQDIYSLGTIFFIISQGRLPFPRTSIYQLLEQTKAQKYKFDKGTPLNIVRIIHSCLRYNESDRKTVQEITDMIIDGLIKTYPYSTEGPLYLLAMDDMRPDEDIINGHSSFVDDFSEMIFIVLFVFFVIPISVCLITRHLKAVENEAHIHAEQNAALAEGEEPINEQPLQNGANVIVV